MSKQVLATVVMAAALVGGCKKNDNNAGETGSATTGSGSATAGSGSATASGSASGSGSGSAAATANSDWLKKGGDAAALPSGDPAKMMALGKASMDVAKPAAPFPQDGEWYPDGNRNGDGNLAYAYKKYVEGELDHYYIVMHWLDCRRPEAKTYAGKPLDTSDAYDYAYCWAKPNGKKLGAYDRYDTDGQENNDPRVIKVGNLLVMAQVGTSASTVAKVTDIETFLQTLPLADLAKL